MAKSNPDVTLILNHFGGPLGIGPYAGKQDEVFAEWKESILALTDVPNVFFKLGGINMKINGFGWHKREQPPTSDELVDATAPYYETCIDAFGAQRCMFEVNFPSARDPLPSPVLWTASRKLRAGPEETRSDSNPGLNPLSGLLLKNKNQE